MCVCVCEVCIGKSRYARYERIRLRHSDGSKDDGGKDLPVVRFNDGWETLFWCGKGTVEHHKWKIGMMRGGVINVWGRLKGDATK